MPQMFSHSFLRPYALTTNEKVNFSHFSKICIIECRVWMHFVREMIEITIAKLC